MVTVDSYFILFYCGLNQETLSYCSFSIVLSYVYSLHHCSPQRGNSASLFPLFSTLLFYALIVLRNSINSRQKYQ